MSNNVKIRFVRSDGKELNVAGEDWGIIPPLSGIDAAGYQVYTKPNAKGDGSKVSGSRIEEREIEIKFEHRISHLKGEMRNMLSSFFNPKFCFDIHIRYMGVTRWIKGELVAFKMPAENIYGVLPCSVYFLCPDPFMRSENGFNENVARVEKLFSFPWNCPVNEKSPVSEYVYSDEINIRNTGDVPTPCIFSIYAKGDVKNPFIQINTNILSFVQTTIHEGDVIIINFNDLTVKINDENALNKISLNADFTKIVLDVGKNIVKYGAELGDNNMVVELSYDHLYLGM